MHVYFYLFFIMCWWQIKYVRILINGDESCFSRHCDCDRFSCFCCVLLFFLFFSCSIHFLDVKIFLSTTFWTAPHEQASTGRDLLHRLKNRTFDLLPDFLERMVGNFQIKLKSRCNENCRCKSRSIFKKTRLM